MKVISELKCLESFFQLTFFCCSLALPACCKVNRLDLMQNMVNCDLTAQPSLAHHSNHVLKGGGVFSVLIHLEIPKHSSACQVSEE